MDQITCCCWNHLYFAVAAKVSKNSLEKLTILFCTCSKALSAAVCQRIVVSPSALDVEWFACCMVHEKEISQWYFPCEVTLSSKSHCTGQAARKHAQYAVSHYKLSNNNILLTEHQLRPHSINIQQHQPSSDH